MSRKLTIQEFIQASNLIHNNKYNYEKAIYINCEIKLEIICPTHGSFFQIPFLHKSGSGCPKCANRKIGIKNSKSTEKFIEQAKKVHGERYDYSKTIYIKDKNKVEIICKEHGSFFTLPGNHLSNHNCKKCSSSRMKITDFIKRSKNIHKDFYSYEKTKYIDNNKKVTITCPLHGDFEQIPRSHSNGHGCFKCVGKKLAIITSSNTNEFIEKAKVIHKNRYNYSVVDYKNAGTKVKIICSEHGVFEQEPRTHLSKSGCPECNKYLGFSKHHWVEYGKNREGIFYIIKCSDENEEFYKVGITSQTTQKRYQCPSQLPYNWEIIKEIKSIDLAYIWDLEKEWKNKLKDFKYTPLKSFAGSSKECFKLLNNLI